MGHVWECKGYGLKIIHSLQNNTPSLHHFLEAVKTKRHGNLQTSLFLGSNLLISGKILAFLVNSVGEFLFFFLWRESCRCIFFRSMYRADVSKFRRSFILSVGVCKSAFFALITLRNTNNRLVRKLQNCYAREGGNPEGESIVWFPACAGDDGLPKERNWAVFLSFFGEN